MDGKAANRPSEIRGRKVSALVASSSASFSPKNHFLLTKSDTISMSAFFDSGQIRGTTSLARVP
jgi:hypothetical protein